MKGSFHFNFVKSLVSIFLVKFGLGEFPSLPVIINNLSLLVPLGLSEGASHSIPEGEELSIVVHVVGVVEVVVCGTVDYNIADKGKLVVNGNRPQHDKDVEADVKNLLDGKEPGEDEVRY